jgi:hypothetical protein
VHCTFAEPGPLGITFGDVDLAASGECAVVVNSVRAGSLASQHVGLVAGLVVHAVQGVGVGGENFDAVLGRIKAAGCVRFTAGLAAAFCGGGCRERERAERRLGIRADRGRVCVLARRRPLSIALRCAEPEPESHTKAPSPIATPSGTASDTNISERTVTAPECPIALEFIFMELGPLGITFGDVAVR